MIFPYEDFDLAGISTYPLESRRSKAKAEDFGRPAAPGATFAGFLDGLPNVLAAADFKAIVRAIVDARQNGGGVVWGLGAHVIKTGLGPILIDLMQRGFVSAIATNGAAIIHDFEVALVGATSEDVDEALGPGRFGMADETGRLLNDAITHGVGDGLGIGGRAGAKPRGGARTADYGEPRFHPVVQADHQRRDAADGDARARLHARRASRDHDPAARRCHRPGRYHRARLTASPHVCSV
jgi:hypothetical protein